MRRRRFPFLLLSMLVLALAGAFVLTGTIRYGGVTGLRLRVQTALAAGHRPADLLLPAPVTPARSADEWDPSLIPPSATPRPTATPGSTATPVADATPIPPAVSPTPIPPPEPQLPDAVALSGFRHEWQTWNNCGPATLAMTLSYYGSPLRQDAVGAALRRSPDDKNVSPAELADYARAQGFGVRLGVAGDADLLKRLPAGGVPILIETWLEEEPNDGTGHYRLVSGYSDDRSAWIAHDAYVQRDLVAPAGTDQGGSDYAGIWLPFAETDQLWKVFNRTYLVVYTPAQAELVASILGSVDDPAAPWASAVAVAEDEIARSPLDPFAWFNLGSSRMELGDAAGAAAAFDQARTLGLPWRMLWYQFAPFAAYSAVGRPQDVLQLAEATLASTSSIEEVWYWRGQALADLGDPAGAEASARRALDLNPDYGPALDLLAGG